jgi:hypothetical protein
MAAGVTDRVWDMTDVAALLAAQEAPVAKRGPYKKKAARCMADDLSAVEFASKRDGDGRWTATMAELVAGWISYQANEERAQKGLDQEDIWALFCVDDIIRKHADLGLDFVLAVLSKKPENYVIEILAAGPLEDILATHGQAIISRVEDEARCSPEFRNLLGGVWQNRMSDDIWKRVLTAGPNRW